MCTCPEAKGQKVIALRQQGRNQGDVLGLSRCKRVLQSWSTADGDHGGLQLSMSDKVQAVMRLQHLISWRNAAPPFSTHQTKTIDQGLEPHRDVFVTTIIISLHNVYFKALALQ